MGYKWDSGLIVGMGQRWDIGIWAKMGHKWDTDWACIDGTYMGQGERKMNGT